MAADKNSTIVFALPLDFVGPLLRWFDKNGGSQGGMAEQRSRGHGRGLTPAVCRRWPSMHSLPQRGRRGLGIRWERPLLAEAGKSNDRLDARLRCWSPNGGADICTGLQQPEAVLQRRPFDAEELTPKSRV